MMLLYSLNSATDDKDNLLRDREGGGAGLTLPLILMEFEFQIIRTLVATDKKLTAYSILKFSRS